MILSQNIKSVYVAIDTERCKGCYYCISVCPGKIIGVSDNLNQNGYTPAEVIKEQLSECTGCISCAMMCPDAAISVYRRSEESNKKIS